MSDAETDISNETVQSTEQTSPSVKEVADEITPVSRDTTPKVVPVEKVEAKSYSQILKANPLYSEASRITHWRDPVKSGLLFGIFNFFYFLITYGEYSFLTLVSYLLLAVLTVCFAYVNYVVLRASWFQGTRVENPLKERFKGANFHINRSAVDQHVQTIVDLINTTIDKLRDAFYVTNNINTVKVAACIYGLAILGKWFNDSTLIYLAVLGLFVWPRLYEEKQREIDQAYALALAEANKYFQIAWSKIPPNVREKLSMLKEKTQ